MNVLFSFKNKKLIVLICANYHVTCMWEPVYANLSWENVGSCSYCITWLNTLCGLSTMCNHVWTGILGSSMTDLPELWFPQFLVMIVAPPDHTFLTTEQCWHHWQNCIFQWPWRGKHSHAPWTIARKKQWYVNQRFSVDFTRVTSGDVKLNLFLWL